MNEDEWCEKEDRIKDEKAESKPSDMEVIDNMERFGGRFVNSLGTAARHADPINRRIIRKSFHVIWGKYSDMVQTSK